jgi:hypothetical protein
LLTATLNGGAGAADCNAVVQYRRAIPRLGDAVDEGGVADEATPPSTYKPAQSSHRKVVLLTAPELLAGLGLRAISVSLDSTSRSLAAEAWCAVLARNG